MLFIVVLPCPVLHTNVYGGFPPDAETLAEPSVLPKQVAFCTLNVKLAAPIFETAPLETAVHPLMSVMVTVYILAGIAVNEFVDPPPFH